MNKQLSIEDALLIFELFYATCINWLFESVFKLVLNKSI
jgi:uncharacterized membrane protein